MHRCKTCPHFDVGDTIFAPFGTCDKTEEASKPSSLDGISYQDYEGYSAILLVGPEFGCIHHPLNRKTEKPDEKTFN